MIANPKIKLHDIEMIDEAEKREILDRYCGHEELTVKDMPVHRLIYRRMEQAPDRIALVAGAKVLTYSRLIRESLQLARLLRQKGVGPNTVAAVIADQSPEMIIGILGILYAGGAYLPVDPGYPPERIDYMLKDCGTQMLISTVKVAREMTRGIESFYLAPHGFADQTSSDSFDFGTLSDESSNLAYIIYTSGSTGRPRGVLVEHPSLMNLVVWHNDYFEVTPDDRATKYAGFGFDASVWEIFPYLAAGAALCMVDIEARADIRRLTGFFERSAVTIAFLPTQMCELFLETGYSPSSLRMMLTGGDRLNRYARRNYRLINNYGPTENTVVATCFPVGDNGGTIPVGSPIYNVRIYILDGNHRIQPVGVPGELHIAGAGVARGYLNLPEVTSERFIRIDSQGEGKKTDRVYKTGDLGRWLPDRNIQFLGRVDQQLKIRGYRIEPGEVENVLLDFDGINETVVIGLNDEQGQKQLYAYYVSREDEELKSVSLKQFLASKLPAYMIPAYFVPMDRIPLTPNGKVDQKALAAQRTQFRRESELVLPENNTEEKVRDIWKEILNIDQVSVNENFFDLGGNSLKIIHLGNLLKDSFGNEIPVMKLFEHATVRSMARYIDGKKDETETDIDNVEIDRTEVITNARQKRRKRANKRAIRGRGTGR